MQMHQFFPSITENVGTYSDFSLREEMFLAHHSLQVLLELAAAAVLTGQVEDRVVDIDAHLAP